MLEEDLADFWDENASKIFRRGLDEGHALFCPHLVKRQPQGTEHRHPGSGRVLGQSWRLALVDHGRRLYYKTCTS